MIDERLREIGIHDLPESPNPAGSYVSVVRIDSMLYVSGQVPVRDGRVCYTGKTSDANIVTAQESARLCVINILAQVKRELGNLEDVAKIVALNGFVNCVPEFTQHPKVINAASDLLVEIFGSERGGHSRMAVGASSLPLDAMTEIGAIIQIKKK